jgi:hypothetical protein
MTGISARLNMFEEKREAAAPAIMERFESVSSSTIFSLIVSPECRPAQKPDRHQ